jgi:hypothetical protein
MAGETELQMAVRHVAEQKERIERQKALLSAFEKWEFHRMLRSNC